MILYPLSPLRSFEVLIIGSRSPSLVPPLRCGREKRFYEAKASLLIRELSRASSLPLDGSSQGEVHYNRLKVLR